MVTDILFGLEKVFPDRPEFRHFEGNSAAHLKASAMGSSVTIIVEDSKPVLGTWQEFISVNSILQETETFMLKSFQVIYSLLK